MKKQFSKLLFSGASQCEDEASSQKLQYLLICKRQYKNFKVRAEAATVVYHRGDRILLFIFFFICFSFFSFIEFIAKMQDNNKDIIQVCQNRAVIFSHLSLLVTW